MTSKRLNLTDVLMYDTYRTKTYLVAGVIFFVLISWIGVMDKAATEYVDDALFQSLLAFASARALNATISVVQSATFSPPMIGGVTVGLGEVLDPMNDLVEQYSTLMKLAIGSLVIQKILLQVVSDTFFKVLITVSGFAFVASMYLRNDSWINFAARIFISFLFLRFLLAVVVFLNGAVTQSFVDEYVEEDMQNLEVVAADVESVQVNTNLTQEERAALSQDLLTQRQNVETLELTLGDLQAELPGLQAIVTQAADSLSAIRDEQSLRERFNPLSSNPERDAASDNLRQATEELESLQREIRLASDELEAAQRQIVATENTLAGRPNSTREAISQGVSGLSGRVAAFGENLNMASLSNRLQQGISSILNLMAAFFLKTLLLPLLFLFLVMKVSRGIWGVDVKDVIQKGRQELHNTVESFRGADDPVKSGDPAK